MAYFWAPKMPNLLLENFENINSTKISINVFSKYNFSIKSTLNEIN